MEQNHIQNLGRISQETVVKVRQTLKVVYPLAISAESLRRRCTASTSSIHTILGRLKERGEVEMIVTTAGAKYYRWVEDNG